MREVKLLIEPREAAAIAASVADNRFITQYVKNATARDRDTIQMVAKYIAKQIMEIK